MTDVDKKISKYKETKRIAKGLRKEAEQLQSLIENLEEAIYDENQIAQKLNNEIIASIKVGDLIEKIAGLLNVNQDEIQVEIIVISGTYAKSLKELYGYKREDAKDLNSYLSISLKDGTHICTKDLRLFNDLGEIEADGYILFKHCRLEKGKFQRSNLIVDKNIDDIICNFRIDAINFDNFDDNEAILPMAIRECIEEAKLKEKRKIKNHQLMKK